MMKSNAAVLLTLTLCWQSQACAAEYRLVSWTLQPPPTPSGDQIENHYGVNYVVKVIEEEVAKPRVYIGVRGVTVSASADPLPINEIRAAPGCSFAPDNGPFIRGVLESAMLIDHAGLTPSRAVALLGESPKESGLQQRQYTYVVRHAQQNITQGLEACPTIRIPDARSANPRVRVMGFVAGEYADGVADVPFGPVTWLPQRIGVEFIYDRVASPVAIKTTPSVLECGNVAGTETRVCNRGFVVEQANGSALPSGRLSFSVAPTAMTGNPTVAKLGGAGTLQVMANGSPVPLDGTTWAGDVTQNPSFVPRITGTGAEMGGKSLNITTTFTAN